MDLGDSCVARGGRAVNDEGDCGGGGRCCGVRWGAEWGVACTGEIMLVAGSGDWESIIEYKLIVVEVCVFARAAGGGCHRCMVVAGVGSDVAIADICRI